MNHHLRSLGVSLLAALALSGSLAAQDNFSPARYRAGPMPAMRVLGIGGGQVFVEVSVGPDGRVLAVTPIRTTPGFTDFVVRAVGAWEFVPAEVEVDPEPGKPLTPRTRRRIASKVLVAAVFRPPALIGPTIGEHPKDVASESDETPFPLTTGTPAYHPVMAKDGGTVLVEVRVDPGGRVDGAAVIVSAPPFDNVALETLGQWSFRPARVRGKSVSTLAYIVFGFPSLDRPGTNKPGTINR